MSEAMFYLPTQILEKRGCGMVLVNVPYGNDTSCTAVVSADGIVTADKIAENALNEYRRAILDVTDMNLRERKEAFGIEDGHCPSVQGLMELCSPAEFIKKVKAYKDRPKTGDVYAGENGNKRYVLWVDAKESKVHYVFVGKKNGNAWSSELSISAFMKYGERIDSETITDFNEFFKGMNK